MLRDKIIVGVHDKKLQLKLLDGRDEQLSKVIDMCKTFEAANANKNILELPKQASVNAINKKPKAEQSPMESNTRFCFNCGGSWKVGHVEECKAKEVVCHNCGKKGHFKRMCRKSKKQLDQKQEKDNGKKAVSDIHWADLQGLE
ncbi:uncharacterized protein LOC118746166 isoform X1 [Rhagoletis pomonella]|uniref:uncharacterized protein LOC118746166 isoform X1 n=1 Tax=Rhagoletis pomonella TaxID=28610 RepID=UPI0017838FC9|nr:uncharacterized protein LOC118746166 isoform X1 [Rhagoletis pomonella]